MIVKREVLQKLLECFADQEEFIQFSADLNGMINEILFAGQLAYRNIDNEDYVRLMVIKQFFVLGVFFKENVELLHEMMKSIEFREVTQKEKDRLEKGKRVEDLDSLGW